MPDWKVHIFAGLLISNLYLFLFSFHSTEQKILMILTILFISLIPDLDNPKSFIRKGLFYFTLFFSFSLVIFKTNFSLINKIFFILWSWVLIYFLFKNLPLKHRGKKSLHQWKFGFISAIFFMVLFLIKNINPFLSLFVLIGYFSHLFLDKIK